MKTKATKRSKSARTLTIIISLIIIYCSTTTAQVLQQASLALVAFYNSTGGPDWNNNSNWLTGPVSTWYGVTVEGERVIELSMYSNNLIGNIPQEVENLTSITKFTLGHHPGLGGNIPEIFDNYSQIKIFGIGNCSMTGTIPYGIWNCSNLSNLSLWENNLSGPIPPEIGNLDSLKYLDMHDNQLTGSIPHELGNCTNLWELRLHTNHLTGELPEELANLDEIYYFDVSFNLLEGDIPDELANVTSYENMFFHNNNFTGIPPWDNNWFLSALWIQNNKMTFEDIEPHFVGYMWFNYAPQDSMGVKIDTALIPGSSFNIYSGTSGEFTEYFWYRNGELILQTTEADTLFLEDISYADTGIYQCWAENSLATELTLIRRPVHITVDTGTNISDNYHQRKYPAIYPNPASEEITVLMPYEPGLVKLEVFDLEGKCVLTQRHIQANNSKITVGIKGLKSGIYLLRIQTENRNYSTKFIINKRGAKH